jgi:hypothetical protein
MCSGGRRDIFRRPCRPGEGATRGAEKKRLLTSMSLLDRISTFGSAMDTKPCEDSYNSFIRVTRRVLSKALMKHIALDIYDVLPYFIFKILYVEFSESVFGT